MSIFNFNNTTPATSTGVNVKWQADNSDPRNVSASVPPALLGTPGVIQLEPNGDTTKFFSGNGTWITPPPTLLKTNFVLNPSQNTLNLVAGNNITLASDAGGVTITSSGGGGGGGNAVAPPDAPPVTPSALDDEFTGTVLDSKWILVKGSAGTLATNVGTKSGCLTLTGTSSGGYMDCGIVQALPDPTVPWQVIMKLTPGQTGAGSINLYGFVLSQTADVTSMMTTFYTGTHYGYWSGSLGGFDSARYSNWNHTANGGELPTALSGLYPWRQWMYLRLRFDGAKYWYALTIAGMVWENEYEVTGVVSSYVPGYVGIETFASASYTNPSTIYVDWFRYYPIGTSFPIG